MSAKRESLQPTNCTLGGEPIAVNSLTIEPTPKAKLRIEPSEIVELHWPGGPFGEGVELVQVVSVTDYHADVDRLELIETGEFHYDASTIVRREWLKPYTPENA